MARPEPAAPLRTATVDSWEDARAHLAEYAPHARTLTALTALHGDELHEIVLDPDTRTVWWAYDNGPLDGEGWTVDQLTPQAAADLCDDVIGIVQDRITDPEYYAGGLGDLDRDQETLDDYTDIVRLTLPADPRLAAAAISGRRAALQALDTQWQRTNAALYRETVEGRGGNRLAAGRVLKLSDSQVRRVIAADDERRADLAARVQELRNTL
ncbi:hypothetical protein [Streptomyces uncialis]|uniref:Uncharacterized protein n=1 Tax=Streptomyces uncialis TaxID=1048205 RepID=A0A1Q4V1A4_9ACTN|nr:hypothetical protein [Streptomyces uncialis]OKH91520.1 hypothetical protein AB852_28610 [Streptomyces uncialis]